MHRIARAPITQTQKNREIRSYTWPFVPRNPCSSVLFTMPVSQATSHRAVPTQSWVGTMAVFIWLSVKPLNTIWRIKDEDDMSQRISQASPCSKGTRLSLSACSRAFTPFWAWEGSSGSQGPAHHRVFGDIHIHRSSPLIGQVPSHHIVCSNFRIIYLSSSFSNRSLPFFMCIHRELWKFPCTSFLCGNLLDIWSGIDFSVGFLPHQPKTNYSVTWQQWV